MISKTFVAAMMGSTAGFPAGLLTLIFTFAITSAALPIAQAQEATAEAEANPKVNPEDPKIQSDNARLNGDPKAMNAETLFPGIPCETGACFKPAAPTVGFSPEPTIEPESAKTPPTKDGKIAK